MQHVFADWDEVRCDVGEFTLPADCQRMMETLPTGTSGRVYLDLADVWRAEECQNEIGYERSHVTLDNGTHVLRAKFGRDKTYAIAWHQQDAKLGHDALLALQIVEGASEAEDYEDEGPRMAGLAEELRAKLGPIY